MVNDQHMLLHTQRCVNNACKNEDRKSKDRKLSARYVLSVLLYNDEIRPCLSRFAFALVEIKRHSYCDAID